jgi:hypothetical protein
VTDEQHHARRSYLAPLPRRARLHNDRAYLEALHVPVDDGATELDDDDLRDFNREGDHYHGVCAFQHDWRSNDALFFAHHNGAYHNDAGVRDPGGNAGQDRVRGRIVQGTAGGRAVLSGRRAVLGLPHDGQSRLRHDDNVVPADDFDRADATVADLDDARERHPSSHGLPDAG